MADGSDFVLSGPFNFDRSDNVGVHGSMWVYKYQQLDGGQAFTIYGGKEPIRQRLHGELWIRPSDLTPFRITIDSTHAMNEAEVRDLTAVDYEISQWGLLLPLRIDHRQFVNKELFVVDQFTYANFKQTIRGKLR